MATFQVPQFIEQKARIIGPLTIEQFLYIAVAGAVSFISYYVFNLFFWLMISVVLFIAAIALAFVKINGQSLPQVLKAGFSYIWNPRTYTWQRALGPKTDVSELEKLEEIRSKIGFQQKLKSIALNVATGKIFSPKKLRETQEGDEYQVVTRLTGEKEVAKRINY